ncbi:MAG: hypothetical protein AAF902_25155 [Chloroflexota bacterium]
MSKINSKKILATFLALGLIGGWIFDQIEHTGLFVDWVQLPSLANSNSELVQVVFSDAYLQDEDGTIWICSARQDSCEESENISASEDGAKASCNFSSPAFSILSNYPSNVEQCVQSQIQFADAIGNSIVVKDKAGNLWLWDNMRGTFLREEFLFISHICTGVLISLIVGLLFVMLSKRYLTTDKSI